MRHHVLRMYVGVEGWVHSSLILTLDGIEWSPSCPGHLNPQKKDPWYLLGRKMSPLKRGLSRKPVRVEFLADLAILVKVKLQGKVKFILLQATKAPRRWVYSSTLSLTATLDGVNATPWPLYPGKDPVPIVQEAELAPGPVWTGAENLASTGFRYPDRPARSKSLYRLRYRGPQVAMVPLNVRTN
jgi:hypothetical protein